MANKHDGKSADELIKLRYELARLRLAYLVLFKQFLDVTENDQWDGNGSTNEQGIKRGQAEY